MSKPLRDRADVECSHYEYWQMEDRVNGVYNIWLRNICVLKSLRMDWNAEPLPDRSSRINSKANEAKSLAQWRGANFQADR